MNTSEKIKSVEDILKNKKIAISFSGGADSTLLAYLAKKVSKDFLAITVDNGLMPTNFLNDSKKIASELEITQEIIYDDFLKDNDFIKNESKRCYICRDLMYEKIIKIANINGFKTIVDGTNISDLLEDRPGILINYKNNILSPFVIAKLESYEIYKTLKEKDINYLKSSTCFATRIKTNNRLSSDKIKRIQIAEDFIKSITKSEIVKVREDNNNAICELDKIDDLLSIDKINLINDKLKSLSFKKVYLNLEEIQNDESFNLDCELINNNFSFKYQLPYKINLEKTNNNLKNLNSFSKNIKIDSDGIIEGDNFKTSNEAKEEFLNILPYLIRKI